MSHTPFISMNCCGGGDCRLAGKRILVTAPRQYARKMAALLIDAGARPVWLPAIEIGHLPQNETAQLDEALEKLSEFSHIAFTSRNGIQMVMHHWAKSFADQQALAAHIRQCKVEICALGADGEALEEFHLSADVRPTDASTQGLVQELMERNVLEGSHVLCPVPSVRGGLTEPITVPKFLEALREGGADVLRLDAYVTQPGCLPDQCMAEMSLLRNGEIDAIVFSSIAEAQGLAMAAGGLEYLQECIRSSSVLLAAHGPFTAAGVNRFLNLDVPCVSRRYKTFDGVISALESALRR